MKRYGCDADLGVVMRAWFLRIFHDATSGRRGFCVLALGRVVRACECQGIAFSTYLKWSKSPEDEDGRSDPQRSHSPLALTEEEIRR